MPIALDPVIWSTALGATLLGARHALEPDHLASVAALVAGDRSAGAGAARSLGLIWGLGHTTSLLLLGVPLIVWNLGVAWSAGGWLEGLAGVAIVALSLRMWRRRGAVDVATGAVARSGGGELAAGRRHAAATAAEPFRRRRRAGAYGIGLLHGAAGSGGVSVVLIAHATGPVAALAALALFALCSTASMALASDGFGRVLGSVVARGRYDAMVAGAAPVGIGFGAWYALSPLT